MVETVEGVFSIGELGNFTWVDEDTIKIDMTERPQVKLNYYGTYQ